MLWRMSIGGRSEAGRGIGWRRAATIRSGTSRSAGRSPPPARCATSARPKRTESSLVHVGAQINAVLQPALERAEQLAPALAIAIARLERSLILSPAFLGDLDQRPRVTVQRLEAHGDRGLVVGARHRLAVPQLGRIGLLPLPFEDDLLVGNDLHGFDREGAGKVVEVPGDRGAGL